jgi:hypothetical protein
MLQYVNSEAKLNQKYMKWVEFLKSYPIVDTLNRRKTLLTTMTVEMIGMEEMKNL